MSISMPVSSKNSLARALMAEEGGVFSERKTSFVPAYCLHSLESTPLVAA